MNKVIAFLFISILVSCNAEKKKNSEWLHSQIVGHASLTELDRTIPALFIAISCHAEDCKISRYSLSNNEVDIELNKLDQKGDLLILEANIESVDRLLGSHIRDSVLYKERLAQSLKNGNVKCLNGGTRIIIPKSTTYSVKFGYKLQRVK